MTAGAACHVCGGPVTEGEVLYHRGCCYGCRIPGGYVGGAPRSRTITLTDKGRAVLDDMRRAEAMRALHGALRRRVWA